MNIPEGKDPFILAVQVQFAIEKLVYAATLEEAQEMANAEAEELGNILAARTGVDLDSPFATVEHGARIPTYNEVRQSVDPDQYPPLEPYFPTLVRDPDDWPDENPEIPDTIDGLDEAA